MATGFSEVVVLRDSAGHYFLLTEEMLRAARVPDAETGRVKELLNQQAETAAGTGEATRVTTQYFGYAASAEGLEPFLQRGEVD